MIARNPEGERDTRYDSFAMDKGWTPIGLYSFVDDMGLMATRRELADLPGFDEYSIAIGEGVPDRSHIFPSLSTA